MELTGSTANRCLDLHGITSNVTLNRAVTIAETAYGLQGQSQGSRIRLGSARKVSRFARRSELRGSDLEGLFRLEQRPRPSFNRALTSGGHLLKVKVVLNFSNEPGMEEVPGAVSDDSPKNRFPEEVEIS